MYKLQRSLIVILLLMTAFIFYGCSKNIQMDKGQDKLNALLGKLKSYQADTKITFFKESQLNVIEMKQAAEIGGRYKLTVSSPAHLQGYVTSFDGKQVYQYNPHIKANVPCNASEARNQILLSSFIHNYLNTKNAKRENGTLEGREVISLETEIPGDYKYFASEKVWFDKQKLVPIKMEIYDREQNIVIQVEFGSFKYNMEINF